MINPFANDSRIQEMKKLGTVNYAVIYPESDTQFDVVGFADKDTAYKYAVEIFRSGSLVYVIDLSCDYVIAYLSRAAK